MGATPSPLRARRKAAGLTQAQLAERAALAPSYISLIERGLVNPPGETLGAIAAALGCRVTDISLRRHPPLMVERICMDCRRSYIGRKTKRCPECQTAVHRQHVAEGKRRERAGLTRKLGSIDICQHCGAAYTVKGSKQMYCPACAPEMHRLTYRPAQRDLVAITCRMCGAEFFAKHAQQRYCSDTCRVQSRKIYMREHDKNRSKRKE